MKIDELLRRLKDLQANPPQVPRVRARPGARTRQTAVTRQRAVAQARQRLVEDVRSRLLR